jgi:predicted nucleic acid-binding protein
VTVFIDTSAFIAYFNRDDRRHADAVRIMLDLAAGGEGLLTTSYTLLETTALLQRRMGMGALQDFQEAVLPFLDVVWVDEELHRMGMTAVFTANRRRLSLVDCISFIVCRQRRIRAVFAFDPHFATQGFVLLA